MIRDQSFGVDIQLWARRNHKESRTSSVGILMHLDQLCPIFQQKLTVGYPGRYFDRRRVLRSRLLRVPGGCRRRLASSVNGLALHLHAACPRISRAQCSAGKPPGASAGHQYALGKESVPDAHQEHDRRPLPAQLVLHHRARFSCIGLLPGA